MRRRFAALVVLAILLVSGLVVFEVYRPRPETPVVQSFPSFSPPAENASLSFGLVDASLSYGIPAYADQAVQTADLDMLLAASPDCIRVDLGFGPWLTGDSQTIGLINSTIQAIKDSGRCLIIADAASETYRNGGQLDWVQFQAAWIQRVRTLAALYRPDYYEVVKEPGWYVDLVSDARTNPDFQNVTTWVNFTETLAQTVKSVSPSTIVGVAVAGNNDKQSEYFQYLEALETDPQVGFIGIDVYDANGIAFVQDFLQSVGLGGKALWIPETWSAPSANTNPSTDSAWMLSLYYFAQSVHAQMVIPFYTDDFANYSLSGQIDASTIVSMYQQRQPVFQEFRAIASQYGTHP